MLKKTMTYTNLDGQEVTEDFYFNMTKAELIKLQLREGEGFQDYITQVVNAGNGTAIVETFEKLVGLSYGEKIDGRFVKKPGAFEAFMSTEAYSDFFYELVTSAKAGAEFINAVMPKDLVEQANAARPATHRNVFDEQPVQDVAPAQSPETMSDDELLRQLSGGGTTAGLTDNEIAGMTPKELAQQPRAVLVRAFQLKNQR